MGDTGEMGVRTKKMGEPPKRKTGNATELNVTRKQIGKFQEGFGKELEQTTREGLRKDSEKVLKRHVKDSETTRKRLGNDSATTRTSGNIAVLHKYIKLGNSQGLIATVSPKLESGFLLAQCQQESCLSAVLVRFAEWNPSIWVDPNRR